MSSGKTSAELRARRHARIRRRLSGTAQRPRLAVFRSNKHIYVQLIDDEAGKTITSASTIADGLDGSKVESASKIGELVGDRASAAGINEVVFDRGGFLYHGRIAAVADGARKKLKF